MTTPPTLSLRQVTIRYGDAVAVESLSLEVSAGEVFGLLGPNGSGKSSTLGAIAGDVPLASGEVRVRGLSLCEDPLAYRRQLGLVPQELAFYEELSARDNLLFFGRLYGLRGGELRERVAGALEFVQLAPQADRPAHTYSGGMQRRLNLACALLHRPSLLLLDEPTVGLDIQSREAIFASLRRLRDLGTALVFTTHHLAEAEQLCDRVGIVDRGKLLAAGSVADLLDGLVPEEEPDFAIPSGLVGKLWVNGRWGQPGLEQVFLELTGRSPRP
jgi:ABC-2 type transport system ATP-binding protein